MKKNNRTEKNKNLYLLSRAITKVLRHTATALHLKIQPNGYVKIEDLVKVPPIARYKPTIAIIEQIVQNDGKQRFEISTDKIYIRAVQGHTMKVRIEKNNYRK